MQAVGGEAPHDRRPQVALLGYGEVGRILADGIAPHVRLRVYDPAHPPRSESSPVREASLPGRSRRPAQEPPGVGPPREAAEESLGAGRSRGPAEEFPGVGPGRGPAEGSSGAGRRCGPAGGPRGGDGVSGAGWGSAAAGGSRAVAFEGGPARGVLVASNAEAVRGAELVIAATTGADSVAACAESLPHLSPGALYVDLSTSAPEDKRRIAELVASKGATGVDGAIMAPVPLRGFATGILASGKDAERFAGLVNAYGMDVTPIGGAAGDAAARKLLRSVLVKGLSALVIESQRAAEAAGLGDWFWGHLLETVTDADEPFVRRLLEGAGEHSLRRVHEMRAATRMLDGLGVDHTMTEATTAALERVQRDGVPPVPDRRLPAPRGETT